MGSTLRNVKNSIGETLEYKNLKRQLDDLPGNALTFIRENFSGLEGAQLVTDITGMIEPTPFSDIAGGIIAVARGDLLSLGTSLLGIVPYVGDLGKLGKWAKRGVSDSRYATISRMVNQYTDIKRQIAVLSQTKALQRTRAEMWDYYQRSLRGENCAKCVAAAAKIRSALPAHGTWSGVKGNSVWRPDGSSNLSPEVASLVHRRGGVPFNEGVPDYSRFATELPGGIRTMPMEMTGRRRDITNAWRQYSDTMSANGSTLSRSQLREMKNEFTWHHTAEGMQMVPSALHDIPSGGPKHIGSRSLLSWPDY